MIKKMMVILEVFTVCIIGLWAVYGMLCYAKTMLEREANSDKTEEIPYKINYSKYNTISEGGQGLLVISGNGIVSKEIVDMFEDVEAVYVCESISGIEPDTFRDHEELKLLVMSFEIYDRDIYMPMMTDLFFIEDDNFSDLIDFYVYPQKRCCCKELSCSD